MPAASIAPISMPGKPKMNFVPFTIVALVIIGLFILFFMSVVSSETYTKEQAQLVLDSSKANFERQSKEGSPATMFAVGELNKIGLKDTTFFDSKLDSMSEGLGSFEKRYGLVQAHTMSVIALAVTVLSVTSYLDTDLNNETKEEFIIRLDSNSSVKSEINGVNGKLSSISTNPLDYSKFADATAEVDGYSPTFINRAKQYTFDYLNEYMAFKSVELTKDIAANDTVAAFIEERQIHVIYSSLGDWPVIFE